MDNFLDDSIVFAVVNSKSLISFKGAVDFYSHKTSIFRESWSYLISIVHIGPTTVTGAIKYLFCYLYDISRLRSYPTSEQQRFSCRIMLSPIVKMGKNYIENCNLSVFIPNMSISMDHTSIICVINYMLSMSSFPRMRTIINLSSLSA